MDMHMWMWFGYDLGPFLFDGVNITTRWAFAITWIVLFIVAVLFEASKVYLAKVQRAAQKKLYPYRSDERRNLLCRDNIGPLEPGTSRNTSAGQVQRWASFKTRMLLNLHQSFVFVLHNTVGYLLMLAVMVYNVELMLAVVLGMMTGYFLFGPKLTRLQMQCFRTKRVVICTPECDDTDRCNTTKCTWEQCDGKLCKEMNSMEMLTHTTNLTKDEERDKMQHISPTGRPISTYVDARDAVMRNKSQNVTTTSRPTSKFVCKRDQTSRNKSQNVPTPCRPAPKFYNARDTTAQPASPVARRRWSGFELNVDTDFELNIPPDRRPKDHDWN